MKLLNLEVVGASGSEPTTFGSEELEHKVPVSLPIERTISLALELTVPGFATARTSYAGCRPCCIAGSG